MACSLQLGRIAARRGDIIGKGNTMSQDTLNKVEQLIESAPDRFADISALYEWSLNYEAGNNPYAIFLDLIGYSHEQLGMALFGGDFNNVLGYMELDYLADALKVVANYGLEAYSYAVSLVEAEAGE